MILDFQVAMDISLCFPTVGVSKTEDVEVTDAAESPNGRR